MSGPLDGIRVIDMTMNVMGPYASQTLGDMGADICKIEPPEGDTLRGVGPSRNKGMGPYFLNLNRNKRSLVLDLKKPGSDGVLRRLLEQADVLLYSFRPKAMARLGASYAQVSAINPRIIYCGAFGYGQAGPYADLPAYDDLIQTAIGLPILQARGIDEPTFVATALIDRTVGLMSASAVGMALYHRERSGEGQSIEVPMFESMTEFVMGEHLYGKTFEPPLGPTGYTRMMDKNRKPYPTKDGHIGVLVYTDKHWKRFFQGLGRPDLASDERYVTIAGRTRNIGFLYNFLAETLLSRTTAAWLTFFTEADIPAMRLNTPDELIDDEHMAAIDFFKLTDHPSEGRIRVMGIPQTWSETQPDIRRLAPRLGEHTVELLSEYGFSQQDIQALMASDAVRQ
ncbi:Crotonobetainyl-CoA:carnitine CoA-transferase CaiB [Rhizobiales bacterium GAS191]|nr:Crotonobetainyl-CoA:carnitine CoA-transferase CaiB [Rhizobiales bacterium GAS191]